MLDENIHKINIIITYFRDLVNIKYWIFDLDNTLYSGQTQVFSEVDKKMSSFISKKFNVDLKILPSVHFLD